MSEHDRQLEWHLYLCEQRIWAIKNYRAAYRWADRKDARKWALHYGRLLRSCSERVMMLMEKGLIG